jgi:hypothetical protein
MDRNDEYDDILEQEDDFNSSEKRNGQCFIGYTQYLESESAWLFVYAVSARSFFCHEIDLICDYLYEFGHVYDDRSALGDEVEVPVDIIQLCILDDGLYTSIVKTHWIRLIQRHWRKVIDVRRAIWRMRARPSEQLVKQRTGTYSVGLRSMPGLVGMLSAYSLLKRQQI